MAQQVKLDNDTADNTFDGEPNNEYEITIV